MENPRLLKPWTYKLPNSLPVEEYLNEQNKVAPIATEIYERAFNEYLSKIKDLNSGRNMFYSLEIEIPSNSFKTLKLNTENAIFFPYWTKDHKKVNVFGRAFCIYRTKNKSYDPDETSLLSKHNHDINFKGLIYLFESVNYQGTLVALNENIRPNYLSVKSGIAEINYEVYRFTGTRKHSIKDLAKIGLLDKIQQSEDKITKEYDDAEPNIGEDLD
jgi:hypothetical protein